MKTRRGRTPDAAPRQKGRPRDAGPSNESRAHVSVWLPSGTHDKLIRFANANDLSVSATVRRFIVLRLGV